MGLSHIWRCPRVTLSQKGRGFSNCCFIHHKTVVRLIVLDDQEIPPSSSNTLLPLFSASVTNTCFLLFLPRFYRCFGSKVACSPQYLCTMWRFIHQNVHFNEGYPYDTCTLHEPNRAATLIVLTSLCCLMSLCIFSRSSPRFKIFKMIHFLSSQRASSAIIMFSYCPGGPFNIAIVSF